LAPPSVESGEEGISITTFAAVVPLAARVVSAAIASVAAGADLLTARAGAGLLTPGAVAAETRVAGVVADLLTLATRGTAETLTGGGGDWVRVCAWGTLVGMELEGSEGGLQETMTMSLIRNAGAASSRWHLGLRRDAYRSFSP
jgi:hypothetical protein